MPCFITSKHICACVHRAANAYCAVRLYPFHAFVVRVFSMYSCKHAILILFFVFFFSSYSRWGLFGIRLECSYLQLGSYCCDGANVISILFIRRLRMRSNVAVFFLSSSVFFFSFRLITQICRGQHRSACKLKWCLASKIA